MWFEPFHDKTYKQFPYIYLKDDFSHYLTKYSMRLTGAKSTIGGTLYKGFKTHYIVSKKEIVTKIKATELSRFMVTDVLKDDGEWLYVFNKELRLG